MESHGAKPDRERQQRQMAYAVGGFLVLPLGIYDYPALVLGALLGGVLAALMPARGVDPERKAKWRRLGWWEAASGVGLIVAYLVAGGPLTLSSQSGRFHAAWHTG